MRAKDWISQFKEQAKGDIKLWFLTSTSEWKLLGDNDEMPKGRMQLQVGFKYYDFYNSK